MMMGIVHRQAPMLPTPRDDLARVWTCRMLALALLLPQLLQLAWPSLFLKRPFKQTYAYVHLTAKYALARAPLFSVSNGGVGCANARKSLKMRIQEFEWKTNNDLFCCHLLLSHDLAHAAQHSRASAVRSRCGFGVAQGPGVL